jgi:leucyl aminopeptidase
VLADALTEADSEDPHLIIDCATLTGQGQGRAPTPRGWRLMWNQSPFKNEIAALPFCVVDFVNSVRVSCSS